MEVDIEKEALTIAANTMKRIADEARAEVARLSNDLAVAPIVQEVLMHCVGQAETQDTLVQFRT